MENVLIIVNKIVDFMISLGPIGGFGLVMIESFLPPIPLGIVVGLNMLSFGNIFGFLLSYVALLTGCMLSFYTFRYLLREKYRAIFNDKDEKKIAKWMKKLSNIKLTTLAVIFALPITPAFLVNIAGGLSNIPAKKYFIALMIGKPAMLLFYGYIAVSFVDSLKNPISFLKAFILIIITYVISKLIEKKVKVVV